MPISYASSFEQIDEERRLLYVGVTRARRTLALSWSAIGRAVSAPRGSDRVSWQRSASAPLVRPVRRGA